MTTDTRTACRRFKSVSRHHPPQGGAPFGASRVECLAENGLVKPDPRTGVDRLEVGNFSPSIRALGMGVLLGVLPLGVLLAAAIMVHQLSPNPDTVMRVLGPFTVAVGVVEFVVVLGLSGRNSTRSLGVGMGIGLLGAFGVDEMVAYGLGIYGGSLFPGSVWGVTKALLDLPGP